MPRVYIRVRKGSRVFSHLTKKISMTFHVTKEEQQICT
jgi:hypothetical protein